MGRRARFRGVKKTPKTLEKDILERSRRLAEDPELLMPECARNCRRCTIRKSVDKMHKVAAKKDDPKKLEFAMNWGDQLVRAYAATISLAEAGKVPYLAAAKTPMGDVSYAVRGKVERDKLIGVQNFDHPELRLMAFWKIAEHDRLHMYSMEDHIFCSPDGPDPPAQYVEEAISLLPYEMDDEHRCPHRDAVERLRVRWKSANVALEICPDCAGDVNTLHVLASRIAAADPTDDFEFDVPFELHGEGCDLTHESRVSADLAARYRRGEMTDAAFLKENAAERLKRIRESGKEIYIIGETCLGSDRSAFLSRLRGGEAEIEAVSGFLADHPMAVVTRSDQAANLLADLWADHSRELLAQVASPETLEQLAKEGRELTPAQAVAEAKRMERSRGITAQLPRFAGLGPAASHADRLARVYLTEGKAAVIRLITKSRGSSHDLRSVSYAFLVAMGEDSSLSWQFTREEMDFGNYLSPFVQRLMSSTGDEYHEALHLLLEAAGSGEKVTRA
ncbi:MAG: hypothetical protein ACOX80_05490 [Methanomassiliicoccaceae archaeon]|jgi:hypothetical protein|nr:hypothetical protein [Euryarchaeota archaeon]HOB37691.1 hypothetical protein [Methanomassiliicoccaceae archaeon]HOQ25717.1 hypothetical protein [Methanomassiliicoccaceae archaeon]HQA20554.1 hypothetical protein [Methanomassiliicoccaceae archaeon]HQD87132.1 hypothetical protein [Methanomassiliicoccaceae archaeon]